MVRSIIAVVVGYLVMAIGVILITSLVGLLFPASIGTPDQVPSMSWLFLSLIEGTIFAVAGGYVTALISRRSEVKHSLYLGILSVVLGIVNLMVYMGKQPNWYLLSLIIIVLPSNVFGGYIKLQLKKR